MLKKLILAGRAFLVAGVIAGGVLMVGMFPTHLRLESSVVIHSDAARIAPFVNDLHRWQEWSTWSPKYDAQSRDEYAGPNAGVGAIWNWSGSEQRTARFEITNVEANVIRVDVSKIGLVHTANFEFTKEPAGTRVTWESLGMGPLFVAWFTGGATDRHDKDVETSLNNLKRVVEAAQ